MAEIPNVRLNLSNRPESVMLVRQALSGLAQSIGLDPVELNDLHTAVSEACNNVVLHAYGGDEGPLEVEVYVERGSLCVVVRDHGSGIGPGFSAEEAGNGIGLRVIRALADSVQFTNTGPNGTEVRMKFATTKAGALERPSDRESVAPAIVEDPAFANATSMSIVPSSLARTVLPRVLSALAARASFSTDRISNTQLLADALAAHADQARDDSGLSVAVSVAPRELELRIGPLLAGGANAIMPETVLDGLGPVVERLTNDQAVSPAGSSEVLRLRLGESR